MHANLQVVVNVDLFDKAHTDQVVQNAAMSGMALLERARSNRSEMTPWANRFPEIALLVPMVVIGQYFCTATPSNDTERRLTFTGSMMLDSAGQNRARQVIMYMRYQTSYAYDCEEALRSLDTVSHLVILLLV